MVKIRIVSLLGQAYDVGAPVVVGTFADGVSALFEPVDRYRGGAGRDPERLGEIFHAHASELPELFYGVCTRDI